MDIITFGSSEEGAGVNVGHLPGFRPVRRFMAYTPASLVLMEGRPRFDYDGSEKTNVPQPRTLEILDLELTYNVLPETFRRLMPKLQILRYFPEDREQESIIRADNIHKRLPLQSPIPASIVGIFVREKSQKTNQAVPWSNLLPYSDRDPSQAPLTMAALEIALHPDLIDYIPHLPTTPATSLVQVRRLDLRMDMIESMGNLKPGLATLSTQEYSTPNLEELVLRDYEFPGKATCIPFSISLKGLRSLELHDCSGLGYLFNSMLVASHRMTLRSFGLVGRASKLACGYVGEDKLAYFLRIYQGLEVLEYHDRGEPLPTLANIFRANQCRGLSRT
ncbi:MAG: hypothetical protein Q9222_003004 [Ikaeria aurantiellina]